MCRRVMFLTCAVLALSLALTAVAQAGLVGWWELDEGSGATAGDSSGKGNNGSLGGGAGWQTGKYGGGVYLDGVDDYIEIPNVLTEACTMAFWFKPDWDGSDPEDYRIFDASLGAIYFFISKGANHADINPAEFGLYFEDAADADWQDIEFDPAGVISAGTWFHVVATWEFGGGLAFVYIDGEEAATSPNVLGGFPQLHANPRFGLQTIDYIPSANGAKGVIDDIRIYDRVLKSQQIRDLFNGIAPTWLKAEEPNPADGAIGVTTPLLQWGKGETGMFHNVYFGTSPDLTEADLVAARQPFALYYHVLGLQPGVTYYWRIDEIEVDMVTVHTGDVWSFTAMPLAAYAPSPPDGAGGAAQAPIVSWLPGQGAREHHLYLGESLDAVKDGAAETDKGDAAETAFSVGLLRAGTTYYWRVDETDVAGETHVGEVWSFTTGQPVVGKVVREWWLGISGTAISALTGNPRYPGSPTSSELVELFEGPVDWADNYGTRLYGWLVPPESGDYTFWIAGDDEQQLWLSTDEDPANAVQIANVPGYTPARDFDNTGGGSGDADAQKSDPITLVAGQKYYIEALGKEGGGGDSTSVAWQPPGGTREVIPGEFVSTYALPPVSAAAPSPENGAVDTIQSPVLSWFAGENAVAHHVYFGDDADAVAGADTTSAEYKGRQAGATYNPGALEWGKSYAWRVDEEEADGTVRTGVVWGFTTAAFLLIEDFESYTDNMDDGEAIFQTWIDGWENGTGSTVGYLTSINGTFGETSTVYTGRQSMPLDYNNVNAPYYSETSRTFAPSMNLTAGGMDTLTLYVRGQGSNDPAMLYVGLKSGTTRVNVAYGDDTLVQSATWVEVTIPLGDFAGVNATAVNEMFISLGNPNASVSSGAGLVFIDAVRVTKAEVAAE